MHTYNNQARHTTLVSIAQLYLRIALAIGFVWPVLDRIGALGAPESGLVAWGNWETFVTYTNSLMPFANKSFANIMALLATSLEVIFAIGLILGYKTRLVALGGALLTLVFALSMAIFLGPRAPLNYPVFVFSSASLALAAIPNYRWSIDAWVTPDTSQ